MSITSDETTTTAVLQGLEELIRKKGFMVRCEPTLIEPNCYVPEHVAVASWDEQNGYVWRLSIYVIDGSIKIVQTNTTPLVNVFPLEDPASIDHTLLTVSKIINVLEAAAGVRCR
jgi:hypothetical protein